MTVRADEKQFTEREVAEYHEILSVLGKPKELEAKLLELDRLIEERKRRDWLFSSIKTAAMWFTAVVAAGVAMKQFLGAMK